MADDYTQHYITGFKTDSTSQLEVYLRSKRVVTYSTRREIYDDIEFAEAAVKAHLQQSGLAIRDGSARRIQNNGWAEAILVTKEVGPWEAVIY